MPFSDLHVVVTGGAGALGAATASLLLDQGATVHIPARTKDEADRFPHTGHPRVRLVAPVELTDEAAVARFYEHVPRLWASVHVAGGFAMAQITDTSLAMFREQMDMNLVSCFLCCREAVRRMRVDGALAGSVGGGRGLGGRIVNVAARPALHPVGGMVAYSCSKAGVTSLTLSLAEELAPEGVWVNAVVPSIMDTPANRRAMPDADHSRWPTVADVARTIVFLASPENRATRGSLTPVYGRS